MALVLVVDDEPIVRQVLGRLVTEAGHEVEEAASGTHALQKCEEKQPAIVFTDLQMGGMDGLTLIERLRASHPEVKLLAVSGFQDLLERAESLGVPVMKKPCRLDDVARKIEQLLEGSDRP